MIFIRENTVHNLLFLCDVEQVEIKELTVLIVKYLKGM